MPVGFLEQHFDGDLSTNGVESREELERRQIERIERALSIILVAGVIPRRLGGDASDEELALDRKRARRAAHALTNSLKGWTRKSPKPPLNDKIRMDGAQLIWADWEAKHLAAVEHELRLCATWALRNEEIRWGRSAVVALTNELRWVSFSQRD